MKQHISLADLKQLNGYQIWILKKLLEMPNSALRIAVIQKCTIGQMIEILHNRASCDLRVESAGENWFVDDNHVINYSNGINEYGYPELCDALWTHIKLILKKE